MKDLSTPFHKLRLEVTRISAEIKESNPKLTSWNFDKIGLPFTTFRGTFSRTHLKRFS